MSRREHDKAIMARRDAEFEGYYNDLLLASAYGRSAYYAYAYEGAQVMSKQFAKDLAKYLQNKSGYKCKYVCLRYSCRCLGIPSIYGVECHFKDAPHTRYNKK